MTNEIDGMVMMHLHMLESLRDMKQGMRPEGNI